MSSHYHNHTATSRYDGGGTVTVVATTATAVAAPANSTRHRVIIDLSQDDSDNSNNNNNNDMDVVVEIFDSPIFPARSTARHLNAELLSQQFSTSNHLHSPLSTTTQNIAQQATTSTPTEADEHVASRLRRRNTSNHSSLRTGTNQSVPLMNTASRNSNDPHSDEYSHHQIQTRPMHQYSQQHTSHAHNNYNDHTIHSGSSGTSTDGTRSVRVPRQRSINSRRHGSNGTTTTRRGHHAPRQQQHERFAIIQHLAHEQYLRHHRRDDNNNPNNSGDNDSYHHAQQPLFNIDNLSYDDLLSIFGNGSENSGAAVTDISLLPVVTVTKEDVIRSETADGRHDNHGDTNNSNQYCCSICLDNYQIGDQKKILPCFHNFHENCVDQWLIRNGSCPICKHRLSTSLAADSNTCRSAANEFGV